MIQHFPTQVKRFWGEIDSIYFSIVKSCEFSPATRKNPIIHVRSDPFQTDSRQFGAEIFESFRIPDARQKSIHPRLTERSVKKFDKIRGSSDNRRIISSFSTRF